MLAATAYQRGMTGTLDDAATRTAEDLVRRMRAGERNAMARVATELERLSPAVPALLAAMQPHLGSALVVDETVSRRVSNSFRSCRVRAGQRTDVDTGRFRVRARINASARHLPRLPP